MSDNFYQVLCSRFPRDRSRTVIETPGGARFRYADLEALVSGYAGALAAAGAHPGERVAVQVDKSPHALFLYLACLRAGCVYLPLNTAYRERELDYYLGDAEPAVVVHRPVDEAVMAPLAARHGIRRRLTLAADGSGSLAEGARTAAPAPPVERTGNDLAAILYTSGTTGRPKGAMITHRNLAANTAALHRAWEWSDADVLLHVLPLFHIHGLFVACHGVLHAGARMIMMPRFDAAGVVRLLPRASLLMGVPTMYVRLLDQPGLNREAAAHVRLFISGSAPLREQTFEEFRTRTGHAILERYGMTETGMNTSNPVRGERRPGTVGRPLPGVEIRIVDERTEPVPPDTPGELHVRGEHVFAGYWRRPEATAQAFTPDGWFRTGDIASLDPDGYVRIVGRARDLVITGGYNVYPREVELVLDEQPGVAESAVIGLPHPDLGEAVTAVVVPADPACPPREAELVAALKREMAPYKVPRRILFVQALPRNTMGKVQKQALRERFVDTWRPET